MLEHSKPHTNKTPVKAKTSTSRRNKTGTSAKSTGSKQSVPVAISSQQRQQMINESAYYIAQRRGFTGGNPMDDWLMAEIEVDKQLSKMRR